MRCRRHLIEVIGASRFGMPKSRANGSSHVSPGGNKVAISLKQGLAGDELFLGFGAATAKSLELVGVSVQPSVLRATEVVFDGAGAGAPRKQFAVLP
jgi:hypothetical protein